MTASDDWNTACRLPDQTNCTNKDAPDFDFASPPILVSLANGRRAIVAGQKSGVVHALDPDRGGEILWQERVGKGGINGGVQWGSAADGSNVYVALSDLARFPVPNSQATIPDPEAGGGMFAMSLESGRRVWDTRGAARLQDSRSLQPGAIGRGERDSGRRRSRARSTVTCAPTPRRTDRSSGTSIRFKPTRPPTAYPHEEDR